MEQLSIMIKPASALCNLRYRYSSYTEEQHAVEEHLTAKTDLLNQKKEAVSDISSFIAKPKRYMKFRNCLQSICICLLRKL